MYFRNCIRRRRAWGEQRIPQAWISRANGLGTVDVRRMPTAAMGEDVPVVAANAPVAGETFGLHVDADPARHPRSAWTDVYGRYVNRSPGAPGSRIAEPTGSAPGSRIA